MFTKRYSSKPKSTRLDDQSKNRTSAPRGLTYGNRSYKTRENLDYIFNAITDPIVVFDADFNVIKINKAAKHFFTGCPIGIKCFFTKHKFALACRNCPIWQTLKTGNTATSETVSPRTGNPIFLKTYPIYNKLKKIKGAVLVGRESNDVSAR